MKFLYPEFLYALTAIGIPILIHLFNFRRFKRVYFPNIRFLKEIKEETRSQQRLKHLLVLLARILAIAALVLAFAQPYIPEENATVDNRPRTVSIFIDNSFSMSNVGTEGELLEVGKAKARQIASLFKESDRFQLLTNNFEGRHQRLVDRDAFVQLVDEVEIGPATRKVSEVVSRQKQALNKVPDSQKEAFIISDFQTSITDLQNLEDDTLFNIRLLPIASAVQKNIVIDSCWMTSPFVQLAKPNELYVRISNLSETDIDNGSVTLRVNNTQKALGSFNIKAGGQAEVTLVFRIDQPGWYAGALTITDFPIVFDDVLHFSFKVAQQVPVLCINRESENKYINTVYASDDYFTLTNLDQNKLDYSSFGRYQLIILNEIEEVSSGLSQELEKFVNDGGSLLIFPSSGPAGAKGLNRLLRSFKVTVANTAEQTPLKVRQLNTEESTFKNVFEKIPKSIDLPKVNQFYPIKALTLSGTESLLTLTDQSPFLLKASSNQGKVFLCASPLNEAWSNLPVHALFVPIMLKLPLNTGTIRPLYYTIDQDRLIEIDRQASLKENSFRLSLKEYKTIPDVTVNNGQPYLFVADQIKEAGNYSITRTQSNDILGYAAFNYNRDESDTKFLTSEALEERLKSKVSLSIISPQNQSLEKTITKIDRGTPLWRLCLLLALVFLGIEILLLKFLK